MDTGTSLSAAALDDLRSIVRGTVRADAITREAYATDASIYHIRPAAVVEPLDREDLLAIIRWCYRNGHPIVPRGGGTSLVGQCVNTGVVIDTSRHLNRILAVNPDERWVDVEPGLIRDELNRALADHGLHFAPDPATTSRASIGGMISNNSAGMRSIKYGMTIDYLLQVELALADGEVITLGPETDSTLNSRPRVQSIHKAFNDLIERHQTEILERFPKVGRRAGGYPLDAFTGPRPWNLAKLIAGSEGTLGMIVSARLHLEPVPAFQGLCLAHFTSMDRCLRSIQGIVERGTSAVELLDGVILQQAREHPLTKQTCEMIQGEPEAILVIECRTDNKQALEQQLASIQEYLHGGEKAYAVPRMQTEADIAAVWLMRESALGLMTTVTGNRKPIPYIEDAAVPLEVLPDYVADVQQVCASYNQPVSLFAHAGAGLLHIRPLHDLRNPQDRDQLKAIQDRAFELVVQYGGSWSGEHGDGIVRAAYNQQFFGDTLFNAFREVKHLFDPNHRMNPGKIIDTPDRLDHLRVDAGQTPLPVETAFRWQAEGGWLRATEQCTGIGACRKLNSGVMCPSYMALRDELHSTRGRANILRAALSGELPSHAWQSDAVRDALDLCLSCKGCYSECPNRVDVGKMKSEWLYQYYQQHSRPRRHQLFANLAVAGRWLSGPQAGTINWLLQRPFVRHHIQPLLGLAAERTLPAFASQRFTTWFRRHRRRVRPQAGRSVLIFTDLYTEYHEPQIGQSAVQVLEALGYDVNITAALDSQRPALSLGLLDQAKRDGGRMLEQLRAAADQDTLILFLEPSCATALRQDLLDLVEDADLARDVGAKTFFWDEFLWSEFSKGRLVWPRNTHSSRPAFLHLHCHQRALDQGASTVALLQSLPESHVEVSNAGCCGMAGAFGYEREHYQPSIRIAEDRLLPAIRELPDETFLVAPGFSCRHQIKDLTGRKAIHSAEYIASSLP